MLIPISRTFVAAPDVLHAVAMQCHAGQFAERFAYIEIAERRYLETGHIVPRGIGLRLLGGHLTLVRQVQTISHQHFGYAGRMLEEMQMNHLLQIDFN